MQSLRQIGAGFLLSAFSVVIVLGGLALALAEGGMGADANPTLENIATGEIITAYPTLPLSFTNTPRGSTSTITTSPTPPPTLVNCPPPTGWLPIVIQSYDTLESLAQTYNTSADALQKSNCLLNKQLIANSIIYVPAQPTSTLKPCGAPAGWGTYTVISGDTLYGIGLLYRVSWQELMQANCLSTSYIKAGQVLRVPDVPISTAPASSSTPIPTVTETKTLEITLTPAVLTSIPTETATATSIIEIPSLTPSQEWTATPSETPLPSQTPVPTETVTPTPS